MSDATNTQSTDQAVIDADKKLEGASDGAAAVEALKGLNELNPADRKAFVANATEYLTRNGELPELMLSVGASPSLQPLFARPGTNGNPDRDGADNMGPEQIAVLATAVETGQLYGQDLELSEQIACQAIIRNYNAIQQSVGYDPTDHLISLTYDINDITDKDHSMIREMGENRLGLDAAAVMFADKDGHFDPSKYEALFGTAASKQDFEKFKNDPTKYGILTPSEKQAVDFMINRFTDLDNAGNKDTKLTAAEFDSFAQSRAVDYNHAKPEIDAFNKEQTVVKDLSADEVDSLIETVTQPTMDSTMFGVLDSIDDDDDGYVSQSELDSVKANNTFGKTAASLAEHLPQFDTDGDGKINLVDLADKSTNYSDAKDNRQVIAMAQDKTAEKERTENADTKGDLTDDTAAAMALFGNDAGELDTDRWNSIFAPEREKGEKGVDVSKDDIWNATLSEKFDTLTPSEKRGVRALYDHFDEYSNVSQVKETLGADEFHTAAFKNGIDWHQEEQRDKINNDQNVFNAKNAENADSEVLNTLREKAHADGYLEDQFKGHKDMSSSELNNLIGKLDEDDPKRNLLEYMSKFHDQLAGDDKSLSMADMDAFTKAASTTADASEDADNVKLSLWWGDENEYKFGAIMYPDAPEKGMQELAEMNNMTLDQLRQCFFEEDTNGLIIPRSVYEQYYGVPYEEQDQAA